MNINSVQRIRFLVLKHNLQFRNKSSLREHLAFTCFPSSSSSSSSSPTSTSKCPPLLILHGLFGSKQNWRSLGKGFAQRLNTNIYALDLRNHGDSPHHGVMDFDVMSKDVIRFISEHGLGQVCLMGHSMGGKVAMTLALQNPEHVHQLIVVDMAPVDQGLRISSEFQFYIQYMKDIENMNISSSKEAYKYLMSKINNKEVVAFLLTNLKEKSKNMNSSDSLSSSSFEWRINLDGIEKNLPLLWTFPLAHPDHGPIQFHKPTLFVTGTRANYLVPRMYPQILKMFPKTQFKEIDAGHWVHAEQPKLFTDTVVQFLT